MKKKILALVVVFVIALSTIVIADPATVDLASMTMEELVALRNEVNAEISSRLGEEGFIGTGSYVVGTDIRPGTFCIVNTSDDFANYYIYETKEDSYATLSGSIEEGDTCTIVLHEGNVLSLSHFGGGTITEIQPTWAP